MIVSAMSYVWSQFCCLGQTVALLFWRFGSELCYMDFLRVYNSFPFCTCVVPPSYPIHGCLMDRQTDTQIVDKHKNTVKYIFIPITRVCHGMPYEKGQKSIHVAGAPVFKCGSELLFIICLLHKFTCAQVLYRA